jgi:5-methylcytosine-specific restriction endonuclease McrA
MERKGGEVRRFVCVVCEAEFERERKPGRPPTVCSPECRAEDNRRRAKGWYHANPARIAEHPSRTAPRRKVYYAGYYAANRASEIQRSLAYARGPGRDAKRARDAARFALTRGAPTAERFTLDEIFDRDGGVCHLCLNAVPRVDATMDHVIPVTKGGPHTRANVKLAHRSCNTRKGNRLLP